MLSLLSALVVVSTAFVGISIYAQTDDSELTTFEEEAAAAGEEFEDTADNATSDDNAKEDGSTSIADLSFLDGLQVCNVGTAEVSGETEVAAVPDEGVTPTVSVEVMTETEVAELAANETETASAGNETSTASAKCVLVGGDNEDDATSTASNATLTSDMTTTDNAASTLGASNATSTASTAGSEEILVIEGQDFAPGQVVLIFSEKALLGIDDVDPDGNIESKIPAPDSGDTEIAGNDTASTELRFVESGTQRTATFEFDGETLAAAAGGDIEAANEAAESMPAPAPAPSGNATSTNSTSSNYTVQ